MTDQRTVRAVVLLLGSIALVGLCGVVGLVALDKPAEAVAVVVGLTGPAIGALATLLASTRSVDVDALAQMASLDSQ